jgi:hypothetical protein
MELVNHTEFPAAMQRAGIGDKEMLCIVACKATYRVQGNSLAVVSEQEAWPVFDKPYQFRGVSLSSDLEFRKSGIDILVFGEAVAPGSEPVRHMPVAVRSGRFRFAVQVFGDREWKKGMYGFEPSEPRPFVRMPLTNDRAFGGCAKWDELAIHHQINSEGRGFCLLENSAEGVPLPNLELPDHLIRKPTETPRPACWFKTSGMEIDPLQLQGNLRGFLFSSMKDIFQQAAKDFVVSPDDLDRSMVLEGFDESGVLEFPLPRTAGPIVHARIGKLRGAFPSTLSSLILLVTERVVIASYVSCFRFLFEPMDERTVELGSARRNTPASSATQEAGHA